MIARLRPREPGRAGVRLRPGAARRPRLLAPVPSPPAARAALHPHPHVGPGRPAACCAATATARRPSTRSPRTTRASIFGLLELFQADGDPAWLDWARRSAAPPGRAVLGRRGGRLVQHRRPGPDHPAAAEGGLRRRGAGGEFGVGAQPADARRTSALRRTTPRDKIERTLKLFAPRLTTMAARGADDAGGAVRLARRRRALNLPVRSLVESEQEEVPRVQVPAVACPLVFCWPLALLAILLYPIVWLLLLPFRLLGIAVEGVLELVRAVVLLPARVLSFGRLGGRARLRRSPSGAMIPASHLEPGWRNWQTHRT